MRLFAIVTLAPAALLALAAAQPARTNGGLWEIRGMPEAKAPLRECLADPRIIAQFEHRGRSCSRVVVSEDTSDTVIRYTCSGGDFGQSKVTVITPRSLRVETQGISGGLPFNYVLQARRLGDCPATNSAMRH